MTFILLLSLGMLWLCSLHALARRWQLPIVPLLLLSGWGLAESDLLGDFGFHRVATPILGITIATVFFEGGRELQQLALVRSDVAKKLVAWGSKLGWLTATGLAGLLLQLPTTQAMLLGALVMIGAPYALRLQMLRPERDQGMAEVLFSECFLLSCLGCAWSVLMVKILEVQGHHPSLLATLHATLQVALAGACSGLLCAYLLPRLLEPLKSAEEVRPSLCLALLLFNFGLAQQLMPGAGMVASVVLGYRMNAQLSGQVSQLTRTLELLGVGWLALLLPSLLPAPLWQLRAALFGLALCLVARPLLVQLAVSKKGLQPAQVKLLALHQPRGVLTLGVAYYAQNILPATAPILPALWWTVIWSNLIPWLFELLPKGPAVADRDPEVERR